MFTLIRKALLVVFLRSLSYGLCSKKTTKDNHVIYVNNQLLTQETSIRYLGIQIDSNLKWKIRIKCILEKVKRCVGILSKLLYYSNSKTLVDLYCVLVVYPFLTQFTVSQRGATRIKLHCNPFLYYKRKLLESLPSLAFFEHSKSRSSFEA